MEKQMHYDFGYYQDMDYEEGHTDGIGFFNGIFLSGLTSWKL